jgi:hypothetical protein
MKELLLFYGLLSIPMLIAIGYTLYVYKKHQKSRRLRYHIQLPTKI